MEYSVNSLPEPSENLWGNDITGLEESAETFSFLNFSFYTNKTLFCIDPLPPHPRTYYMSATFPIIASFILVHQKPCISLHFIFLVFGHLTSKTQTAGIPPGIFLLGFQTK